MGFLTEEEQYKEVLSAEDISRIKDTELREIRFRFWKRYHEVFLNEQQIRDDELEEVCSRIRREEEREIEAYRSKDSKN